MIRLRAIETFPYDNKTRSPGELFEAPENDAHVLTTIGKAELVEPKLPFAQGYTDRMMTPDTPKQQQQEKRDRYRRRDMRAKE